MSEIRNKLQNDLKDAMKSSDKTRVSVIRDLLTALTNEMKEAGEELDRESAMKVLKRKAKQRRDSIESFKEGGRDDLVEQEESELEIIEEYLPEQLSDEELENIIEKVINEINAVDMSDMGKVMGKVMDEVGAKAEGGKVSDMVKSKLK